MKQLPKGYYAVQSDFENAPKDSFTYRGETYSVEEGVNLFGSVVEANAAACEVPDVVLEGLPYEAFSAPVLLFSTGKHRVDKLAFSQARVLLGEGVGVSPNLPARQKFECPEFNPERADMEKESILYGGYWYGTMRIAGEAVPLILLDGFTMMKSRFYDSRTTGECDTEIIVRNVYHTSPCLHTIYSFDGLRADSPMHRTVLLEHVRLQKDFDELGYGRLFMSFASNKVTFRDLCIDGTSQLFGFTTISRASTNCAGNSELTQVLFEQCYVRGLGGENGVAFSCPAGMQERGFVLRATDTAFIDASRAGEAPLQPHLVNDKCALVLERCLVRDTRGNAGAAIAIRDKGRSVTLSDCTVEGFAAEWESVVPPPSNAPDHIKNQQRAWTTKTDDPHRVIGTSKADFSAMDAYYEGCKAYYGDQHVHSACGGTSDGKFPLKDWVAKMDELSLDFAIVVDHRQMRGYFLPEWDETRFLYGTEPGTNFSDLEHLPNNSLHYNMIFPHKYGLAMVLANFPEFKFKGDELTGSFGYPKFTTERFKELNAYIRSIGGMLVHAHPKLLLASNDPLDYYAGEHSYLETIVNGYGAHGAFRACDLWDQILKLGKHMYASGGSDTHGNVSVGCPSTFYTTERHHSKFVERMYVGDYAVGGVGVRMMIDGHPMGSELAYRDGMKLTLRVGDFFKHTWKENTAYELRVLTDKGVAYASMFNGKELQELSLEVQKRMYYRVEILDLTHGYRVCVSNPIWLDKQEAAAQA